MSNMPDSESCPIGPLNLHTYNHERTECIWCGPGAEGWKPGRWVKQENGSLAWSIVSMESAEKMMPRPLSMDERFESERRWDAAYEAGQERKRNE